MIKRGQTVTVGIAGLHSQHRGRILRRGYMGEGWWIVREIPADDERAAFLKRLPRAVNGACVHESQIQAAS
jgi:hypothetical protein